ncbi:MAG: hypothetical protein QM607_08550 [Microbacterium sp.]
MDTHNEHDTKPLGFWLRTVDGLISDEFADAFADTDSDRRDWMLLNLIDGSVDASVPAACPAACPEPVEGPVGGPVEGLRRKPRRLIDLAERGLIEHNGTAWVLTDAGREAKAQLGEKAQTVRDRVAGAVSEEDYATMLRSLEAIARELGWPERRPPHRHEFGPKGRFGRRGFGHGRHRMPLPPEPPRPPFLSPSKGGPHPGHHHVGGPRFEDPRDVGQDDLDPRWRERSRREW